MFVRISQILLILALVATLGAHWAVLQTVAWTSMLANHLRSQTLTEAICQTFDGEHPCSICLAIAADKNSEKKDGSSLQKQKLEFLPANEELAFFAPPAGKVITLNSFLKLRLQMPLLPPPRGASV